MKILIRKVWVGKILHNFRLKIQGRRSALPQAWELTQFTQLDYFTDQLFFRGNKD